MRQEHVLTIVWSAAYRAAWDATPEAYVEAGVVGWSRSRRLARAEDASAGFKAYVGVQHYDPSRWHVAGERVGVVVSFFRAVVHLPCARSRRWVTAERARARWARRPAQR